MMIMQPLNAISKCRICYSDKLEPIFSLGTQAASDFVDAKNKTVINCPLELVQCQACSLVQLKHTVDRESLYRHYYYRSGTNELMRAALKDIVQSVMKRIALKPWDIWVDIGSNDATLLKLIPEDYVRIGFEPASNFSKDYGAGMVFVNDFFTADTFNVLTPVTKKRAKVVTAIACFYDLVNPHKFVQDVKDILAEDGLFVIQQNYLGTMLANNAYDNISHEHLQYYSLKSLKSLLEAHGLEIVDVELNDVNGGCFRTYIQHKDQSLVDKTVRNLEKHEERTISMLEMLAFVRRIEDGKEKLVKFLEKCKSKNQKVYGYGACYDEKTRVVTPTGFKTYGELHEGDTVYTMNIKTRELQLQQINEVHIYDCEDSLIHFTGKRVDLLVTPNHRMLVNAWRKKGKIKVERAEETAKRSMFYMPRPVWLAPRNETVQISSHFDQEALSKKARRIPNQIPTEDFLYLLGLYIGDGFCDTHGQGFRVFFCIPEKDKARNPLISTLERLNIQYRTYWNGVAIASAALVNIFSECGKNAHVKHIPTWALQYASSELAFLLRGLIDSDGWYEKNGRIRFKTVSEQLVIGIVELAFKLGIYPTVAKRNETACFKNGRPVTSMAFTVGFNRYRVGVYTSKAEHYSGVVWCVTVPNSNLLVERNGRFAFCGNSNRGNTILQYCGINGQLLTAIADRNAEKWGKRTVATDIPIVSEEVMRKAKPKYLLILPYFYLRAFMSREIDFLKNGGTFIIPLPSPKLIHFKNGRAQLELI